MFLNSSFFTALEFPHYSNSISPNDTLLTMGSCFADRISSKLVSAEWKISSNPGGILFHPIALAKQLQNALDSVPVDTSRFVQHDDLWFHLDWHSSMHAMHRDDLLHSIETKQQSIRRYMLTCHWALITFGTAIGHYLDESIVSNCHKQPKEQFQTRTSTLEEIRTPWLALLSSWEQQNTSLKLLFTVSPVKHTRSGILPNTLSKARLLESTYALIEKHNNRMYFPAYELLTECLRDYRFYAEDMAHPSGQATEFIIDQFIQQLMDKGSQEILRLDKQRNSIQQHKPLYDSESHHSVSKKIIDRNTKKIRNIRTTTP